MSTPKLVREHLAEQRWEPAMDALVAAWRSHRAPELERAIQALADHLAAGVEPIADEDDWQEAWDERARASRSVELGVLLPFVTRPPKGMIPRRLRALLEFGGDPRIGALLVEMIETPPLTASSNFSMWTELFAALPSHADKRVSARLEARKAERGGKSQFWDKLEAWIKAVLVKLPEPAPLPEDWKADLAALERQIAALANQPAPRFEVPETLEPTSWDEVEDLGAVQRSLEAGELARALDLLVGHWGPCRSPVLAALIERLALMVDADAPAAGGGKGKDKDKLAAWLSAAEHPQPSTIGPLLASLREGKLADVETKLERLVGWRPDPRVAQAMLVLVKDNMIGARPRFWRAVYEALVVHADPRIADVVRARHERLANAHALHRHIAEGREIRRVYEAFTDAIARDHALTGDAIDRAEAIAAILAARVASDDSDAPIERRLVEAIVADWASDAPRLVYSDWLQSKQDPRGEWISLELALAQGKKVKGAREKWLRAHKNELFGPLAGLMTWGEEFERGLLSHVAISTKKGGLDVGDDRRDEILEDLRWATIRSLDVGDDDHGAAQVFARAPLLGLQRLERPSLKAMQGFASRRDTLGLPALAISGSERASEADWLSLGELARVLPAVESLEIMIWGHEGGRVTPPEACFRGELVRRAKVLINGGKNIGGIGRVDQWIERMAASACPVPRMRMIGSFAAEVEQVELGEFELALTIDLHRSDGEDMREVIACLRGLPRDRIKRVKLRLKRAAEAARPDIEAALEGLALEPS